MDRPSFWIFNREVENTLQEIPSIDNTITSWDDVDRNISDRFTIITGITWIDGSVLPIVLDQKHNQEYCELDLLAWNGPHYNSCEGEKTSANIVDCVCIQNYCRTLLKTISEEILNSEKTTPSL